VKVLVTGGAGFIAGYLVEELLQLGYEVIALDNFSKYGPIEKSFFNHPNFYLVPGDAKDTDLMKDLLRGCDHLVAGAAMIGGITYFHKFAYDLLAENERIMASTFDAAIHNFKSKNSKLKKITVLSSSMVYESTRMFPTPEGEQLKCPPPLSTYGFQKLACEYFCKGAFQQYGLPYTIVRPFNCVGIGERRAKTDVEVMSGNVKLAMSHVVPDIVQKILKGQDPVHILGDGNQIRHYTYGGDLAKGIVRCMEAPEALNEDFNISTAEQTSVIRLVGKVWEKLGKNPYELRLFSDPAFEHDVQLRVPRIEKAKYMLGFECTTSLDKMLDEVIPWIKEQMELGTI